MWAQTHIIHIGHQVSSEEYILLRNHAYPRTRFARKRIAQQSFVAPSMNLEQKCLNAASSSVSEIRKSRSGNLERCGVTKASPSGVRSGGIRDGPSGPSSHFERSGGTGACPSSHFERSGSTRADLKNQQSPACSKSETKASAMISRSAEQ